MLGKRPHLRCLVMMTSQRRLSVSCNDALRFHFHSLQSPDNSDDQERLVSDIWLPWLGAMVEAQGWPVLIIPQPSVWLRGSENITKTRPFSSPSSTAYKTQINQDWAKQSVPSGHLVVGTSLLCRTWRSSFFRKITAWERCQTNNYIINDINSVRRAPFNCGAGTN